MKKIIFLLSIVAFLTPSCGDDFLELNPVSDAASSNFFKTAADIEVAVNGIYGELQSGAYYGNTWRVLLEYRSDNIDDGNTARNAGQDANINKFRESASNGALEGAWEAMYRTVSRANTVLNRIEEIEMEAGQKSLFRAEAHFLRALTYFNLVRLWGEVPLILEESQPEQVRETAKRNNVGEVYTKIEEDLNFAITNLPSRNSSGRGTKEAATIVLAKTLITQGKYAAAIPLLQNIDMTSLLPLSEVWDANNELNAEMIFVVRFRSDLSDESHGAWYNTNETPLVSNNLRQAYVDAGDVVRGPLIESNNDLGGDMIPLKFQEAPFGGGSYGLDYPVIRKSDAVLLLAEALNEEAYDADGEAFDLLNSVRSRAGLADLNAADLPDQDTFRDAIFEERRLEFALEGHRWFDLKRAGNAAEALAEVGVTFQPFQLLYPLPQSEIDAFQDETRFPQNPGYN
ncbi:RagB/SusD family nutrient uptake outer membrane protein [Fulvivirga sp. M361]|uniref:RagB/SusD family nutrient uptake outer membrane protein n=1 Tax=Fulvivirga sp. M361 TaxID=2594266 RepID=UPI00117BA829|nr:RagB/SusD family nutrient uptake outer membrane protein [Fulvivirga sp. M361]TRX60767.1 RagB/SusD family nutrient uptake outer membrane protein [Fulvivirga sp. M361]